MQGLSTSLPEDVQLDLIRSVQGMENAQMMRTGYAIEYDVVKPHQLRLFFGNKISEELIHCRSDERTSGYEEAAGQGIIASASMPHWLCKAKNLSS